MDAFAFIAAEGAQYGVARLCRRFGVARSGYYAWRARPLSAHAEQDRQLTAAVTTLFAAHRERYGSPRIHDALVRAGWRVSRRRVARVMQECGLRAKAVRGYRAKAHLHRFYAQQPNRLRGRTTTRPNQIWVGDITYLAVAGHWHYLAVVMDHFSRRVLAWTLTRRRDGRVTRAVLAAAVQRRRPARGLIFHSDRGTEYLGAIFRDALAAHGITQSASEIGPGDNARMESFFHSLKGEAIRGQQFTDVATLRAALRRYLHYYNHTRAHSALGYECPVAFERGVA